MNDETIPGAAQRQPGNHAHGTTASMATDTTADNSAGTTTKHPDGSPALIDHYDATGNSAGTERAATIPTSWQQINDEDDWICLALAGHDGRDSDGNPDARLDLRICEHSDGRTIVQGYRQGRGGIADCTADILLRRKRELSRMSREVAKAVRDVAVDIGRGLQGGDERATRLARECITDFLRRRMEWLDLEIADAKHDGAVPTNGHRLQDLGFTSDEAEMLEGALEAIAERAEILDAQEGLVFMTVLHQAIERRDGGDHDRLARLAEKVAELSPEQVNVLFGR